MNYKLIIFDFDGTLADSFEWFINIMERVAEKYNFKKIEKDDIEIMRKSNADKMLKHHGISSWKIPFIGKHLRKLMAEDIDKIHLFEGISDLLKNLTNINITIGIVTSNSYKNVCKVLGPANSSLIKFYECGVSLFGKSPKIKKIIKLSRIPAEEVIFIGDEIRDSDAARKVGIKFGAVSWGYTNIEALKAHAPDEVFTNADEIIIRVK
jgi:phosphoglycolate phosphatase